MNVFEQAQADYYLFLCVVSYILLLALSISIRKNGRDKFTWIWLGLFSVTQGIATLITLTTNVALYPDVLGRMNQFSLFLFALASFFLIKFSWSYYALSSKKRWNILVDTLGVLFLFLLLVFPQALRQDVVQYLAGISASIICALVFDQAAQNTRNNTEKQLFNVFSFLFIVYAASLLIVPEQALAVILSEQAFLSTFHVPIYGARSLIVFLISLNRCGYILYQWRKNGGEQVAKRFGRGMVLCITMLSISCFWGWVATEAMGRYKERELKKSLLGLTTAAAATFPQERVIGLQGIPEDAVTYNYKHIKSRLENLQKVTPGTQSIYLMGFKNREVFFYANSENTWYDDLFFSGKVYQEAPLSLKTAFFTGEPLIDGPLKNERGICVSGFAPIKNDKGQVVAMLGVDMPVQEWQSTILYQRLLVIYIFLVVCIILISFFLIMYTIQESSIYIILSEQLLKGVAEATGILLTMADAKAAFTKALAIIGQTAGVDRVYIFENHYDQDNNEILTTQRYEWCREKINSQMNGGSLQGLSYSELGIKRWKDLFLEGKIIKGMLQDFPPEERAYLESQGISSFIAVPIITENKLLGFVGFDDFFSQRVWSSNEEAILHTLAASIGGAMKRYNYEAQIRFMAFHDMLTKLPNRNIFNDRLTMALNHAKREGFLVAVMYLDLDGFKPINDSYGHEVGDMLLKEVANRLTRCLRKEDTVARIGGDEFTILVPKADSSEHILIVARKILKVVQKPVEVKDLKLQVTTSIGIAIYPQHGSSAEILLKRADIALYIAKEQGKNNIQFYTNAQLEKRLAKKIRRRWQK